MLQVDGAIWPVQLSKKLPLNNNVMKRMVFFEKFIYRKNEDYYAFVVVGK